MKVLQISIEFLPSFGGIQMNMYNIATRLAKRGHEVTVLTTNMIGGSPVKLPSEEVVDSIRVLRIPVLPNRFSCRFAIAPSVVSKLLSVDTDVVHVFSLLLPGFLTQVSCIIPKLRGIPLIINPVYHPIRYAVYKGLVAKVRKAIYDDFIMANLLRRANCVIAMTETEAQCYRKMGTKNTCVIPPGFELSHHSVHKQIEKLKQRFGLDGKVILHVGRLDKRKGVQYAIHAMPLILKDLVNAKLLLVGPNSGYEDQLRDLSRDLRVEDSVVFAGRLSSSALDAAFRLSDVVIIPSIWESLPGVGIEAFAYGKPIVASKTIGFAEWITANNGILVDPGDYEALGNAVSKLLSDPHLAESMGRMGQKVVEKEFSWERIIDKIEEVYCSTTA